MEVQDIIKSFEIFDGDYKRKEIDASLKMKEEITSHLIKILEIVAKDPVLYKDVDSDYFAHKYAVYLLSQFKESQAHNVIVDLFSLPGEMSFDLFGDIITEDLQGILYSTCGGSLDRIKAMIINKKINKYCRSAALQAMSFAIVDGLVNRESVMNFFESLFPIEGKEKDLDIYTPLVNVLCDLYPEELMDKIEILFKEGLVDTFWTSLNYVKHILTKSKSEILNDTKNKFIQKLPDNFHKRMSWWSCFKTEDKIPFPSHPSGIRLTIPKKRKKKKKEKKRKK